jgi:hypothetical protein
MDRINSLIDYDYLRSSVLPDSELTKAAMPSMDFLQNYVFRSECESEAAIKAYRDIRGERIQKIEACAQESSKLLTQNCFGEFLRKCVKRKTECERKMLTSLHGCNIDTLKAAIIKDSLEQVKQMAKEEESKMKMFDTWRDQSTQASCSSSSNTAVYEEFVVEWNRYHTMGRDLNGFFRVVNNDYGFSYLEKIIAKSLGQEELSFGQKLSVEKVEDCFFDTSDAESSTTESIQDPSFSDIDVERLSNDCISISEENKLLLEACEKKKERRMLEARSGIVTRSETKKRSRRELAELL